MQIFGLMIVRNEADVVRLNLLHHLALGIDRFLVVDNGSSDGTDRVLQDLSRDGRVTWTRDTGPYRQSEITTELALEAYLRGADWVIPIDADEFWYTPNGDLREFLEQSGAGALRVEVVNYIQRHEQHDTTPDLLLSMTRRAPTAIGSLEHIRELVETRQFAFVEVVYAPKWISRASPVLNIGVGNHEVSGIVGPSEETDRVMCLHAPLRSRPVFEAQVAHARRAVEAGNLKAWHWMRWQRLAESGELELEWRANSYENGCLDVYGVAHPVVEDYRLRDVVAPWIGAEFKPESPVYSPPLVDGLGRSECKAGAVEAALAKMGRIEGWLTEPEAMLLLVAATLTLIENEPHDVVELGSYCGRSTVVLGSVVKMVGSSAIVHAIDPHEGKLDPGENEGQPTLARFVKNVEEAGVADVVRTIRKRPYEVTWNQPINLLFIDGIHDYDNVSRDFAHFQQWVIASGFIAFHNYDTTYPGVITFVDELLATGEYRRFQKVGSLMVVEKLGTMSNNNPDDLAARMTRQEKGISVLREVLRDAMTRGEHELEERDGRIIELQKELFAKVEERDQIIRNLQAELHQKVGEANQIIRDLQAEIQTKVSERDQIILNLQAVFRETVGERDEIIQKLQKDLERN